MRGSSSHSEKKKKGKSSQNSPKLVLILKCRVSIPYMCIVCVYTLLKVVSHYDLSVLSKLVTGFPPIFFLVDGFGWVSSIRFLLLTLQSLL